MLHGLLNTFRRLDDRVLLLVFTEIVATTGDLRARVNPKYRFAERMLDLTQCLLLDGYIVQVTKLAQIDRSIADAAPLENDLIVTLQNSGAPRALEIISKISDSAQALGAPQFDEVNQAICARMQKRFGRGRDYTYTFPGIQKVVQAAGRVIRTESDTGAILLMDERYLEYRHRGLLPQWWRIGEI